MSDFEEEPVCSEMLVNRFTKKLRFKLSQKSSNTKKKTFDWCY